LKNATILIAPVIGGIDLRLYPLLAKYGRLAVTPQGYFRRVDNKGFVSQKKWTGFAQGLAHAKIAVMSDEDITIDGKMDFEQLSTITSVCQTVVLTKGAFGADIYKYGELFLHADSYKLEDNETVDFTGAGDTYATAFIMEISKGLSVKQAAASAAFFAALKIQGITGIGIDSIPTQNLVKKYMAEHKDRTAQFISQEKISTLVF
jgi:sugar/nucleoside kinase (ribokinase family)